jgi:type II protein arginine methyltransferase
MLTSTSCMSEALSVPRHLPDASLQSRWFSEPVRILTFDQSSFLQLEDSNSEFQPSLPRAARAFVGTMMRLKIPPWILLWDIGRLPDITSSRPSKDDRQDDPIPAGASVAAVAEAKRQQQYEARSQMDFENFSAGVPALRYLRAMRILQGERSPKTALEQYGSGYQDFMQVPLQPLTDNLESMTYEVFEKDPVKYDLYEEAIRRALVAFRKQTVGNAGVPADHGADDLLDRRGRLWLRLQEQVEGRWLPGP